MHQQVDETTGRAASQRISTVTEARNTHETGKDELASQFNALPVVKLGFVVADEYIEFAESVNIAGQDFFLVASHQQKCANRNPDGDEQNCDERADAKEFILARCAIDVIVCL
jgi:hypothetical protein